MKYKYTLQKQAREIIGDIYYLSLKELKSKYI